MKILLVAGDLPRWSHGVRAADLVLSSLIDEIQKNGHSVVFQLISRQTLAPDHESVRQGLHSKGITVLPWLTSDDYRASSIASHIRRAMDRRLQNLRFFYPSILLQKTLEKRVQEYKPDVALLFWVPEAVAATASLKIPRLAYYGMPDHAARLAQLSAPELFNLSSAKIASEKKSLERMENYHLELMRGCTCVANLSADHALYYKEKGHPNAVYIQNMWPMTAKGSVDHHALQNKKLKICGNVGRPAATGNTFGLHFLGTELLPKLDAALGQDGYEMHLFGKGEPFPAVAKVLQHPAVKMRGWVEDIDAEIRDCQIFLVANNAHPAYRGSHTRFLHAWTMKACCVGHSYNLKANPEMKNGTNVLLGETAEEIAQHIVTATKDPELRQKVGESGFATYNEYFTPPTVTGVLLTHLERIMRSHL